MQFTSASPTRDANDGGRRILLNASGFRQSIEGLGYIERIAAAEQTANFGDSSPSVIEQFEYLLIKRLSGARSF
jgi:hypothetical protein